MQNRFKVRARLLEQLGEQLIKSESIALMELIKNAYDADAVHCSVQMNDLLSPDRASIIITDDGCGMDYNLIQNVWLDIGTSYKAEIKILDKKRTPKFNRYSMGEKGIGRFGVHRLGREIEIITRMQGKEECRLFIDWDNIRNSKYIEDFPIELEKRIPEVFTDTTGTRIIIRRLKGQWDRKTVRDCHRSIVSLTSPFEDISNFKPVLELPNSNWLEGLVTFDDIKDNSLFSFEAELSGDTITDFIYNFTPYSDMSKLEKRTYGIEDLRKVGADKLVKIENRKQVRVDLSEEKIGPVVFKGLIFDLDSFILRKFILSDIRGFKDYLSANGGIRVFRDNLRIWNYGEPEDDWLEMDTRRINQPALKISKRLILGAVFLKGDASKGLIEKANREGFMDNRAYQLLKDACRSVLGKVELLRRDDKERLRKLYGSVSTEEPVITSLADAKKIIQEHVKDEKVSTELNRCLDKVQADYELITNNLIKSAGAGLNLIIVIHQMQKIIKNVLACIRGNSPAEQIRKQIEDLERLVEGYSILTRKSEIKIRNLKGILERCMFNMELRFDSHNIHTEAAFRERQENLDVWCSESHVMNAVMNLVDNSIWWMDIPDKREKSLFIDISAEHTGYITVIVADTGPGFSVPTESLGKAFFTTKPDGADGMGIGLYLTSEIMEALGGKLLFPEFGDFTIPEKYRGGAIVALAFRKKGK